MNYSALIDSERRTINVQSYFPGGKVLVTYDDQVLVLESGNIFSEVSFFLFLSNVSNNFLLKCP